MTPKLTACINEDLDKLNRQYLFAQQRLQVILGECLFQGDESDLQLIQRGLDSGQLDHVVDLQCLGVPLGELLIQQLPNFAWWMLEDELGITPCIRYGESSLIIFPLTLISKRVELGESIDVISLYADLKSRIEPLRQQLDNQLNSAHSIH